MTGTIRPLSRLTASLAATGLAMLSMTGVATAAPVDRTDVDTATGIERETIDRLDRHISQARLTARLATDTRTKAMLDTALIQADLTRQAAVIPDPDTQAADHANQTRIARDGTRRLTAADRTLTDMTRHAVDAHHRLLHDQAVAARDQAVRQARQALERIGGDILDPDARTRVSQAIATAQAADDTSSLTEAARQVDATLTAYTASHDAWLQTQTTTQATGDPTGTGHANSRSRQAAIKRNTSGRVTSRQAGTSGYTTGGDCYDTASCQSRLDTSRANVMQAFHTPDGSTYYGIHSGRGGDAMWGKGDVTINGRHHTVGQWTQAQYVDGKPVASTTTGTYVQTCHNGTVWYAPIN
ncbi:hypothetical protein CSQ85_12255 [Bifidobacterium rousetti]|uniref:hypothetical protein n=1 Tax=Bifidobacterium rousetti TaxID=2045439 RepID=UPI001238BF0D|nr:hypothetical protein [Bifidobacterium rousetti]KAA8815694.1 hypothetical protein CSQ85_12255 [Bifidobacterium rousetti]